MSKERELLKRVLVGDDDGDLFLSNILYKEIEKLLAQPEHIPDVENMVEQEPVAWMQDSIELYVLEEKSAIRGYVIPLYTAPPKREPLSYEATSGMFHANKKATNAVCYWAGVYDAEKAHGIGGE